MSNTAERGRNDGLEGGKELVEMLPPLEDRVVDSALLLEFSCAICLHLISEPRQCNYGHNICLKCFQDLVKYPHLRSECPTCRCPMDREHPNRNLVLENLLAKLDVYCRYHFIQVSDDAFEVDEEGCQVHMSRLEIEKHERTCPSAFVACPHSSACGSLRRGRLESHLAECVYKPVSCMYCGAEMMRRLLESHFVDCPDLPLTCRYCSHSVAQKRMRRHLERECEGKQHKCPYEAQGCLDSGEMSAKDLALHMRDCASEHLELVQQQTVANMKVMENKFTKMLAIKDAEIEELKRASRNRYRFNWDVQWRHVLGDTTIRAYTSEKFDIFGRKFYLALWPIGEPSGEGVAMAEEVSSMPSYSGDASQPISIVQNALNANTSTASSFSNLGSVGSPSSSSGVPGSSPTATSFFAAQMQQQQQQQQQALSSTPTSSNPAPLLGTSPKSLSSQLLDRLKSFVRPRSSSQESLANANNNANANQNAIGRPPTFVAVYLMMEDEQPAPASSAAAPRIYSPISGLVPPSAFHPSSTPSSNPSAIAPLRSATTTHDPFRSMNVNLMRHQPYFSSLTEASSSASSSSNTSSYTNNPSSQQQQQMVLPMRPPESMLVEYTLRLVNSSPLLTKSSYFEVTFPLANGNGWGEENFIETSQISQASGFLDRNFVLHVQCDIQVRQCTFDV